MKNRTNSIYSTLRLFRRFRDTRILFLLCLLGLTSLTKSYGAINLAITTPASVPAGSACAGSTNTVIYRFTLTASGSFLSSTTFTGLTFTQSGTAGVADIIQYKLWSGTAGGTLVATSSGATPSFSGFSTSYSVVIVGTTLNYFITADILPGATAGHTITVDPLTTGNITVAAGATTSTSGSILAGGAQTIGSAPTVSGATALCAGSNITLTGLPSGGTWASSTSSVATIGPSTGIVGGIIAGTAVMTYTQGGCAASLTDTVTTLVPASFVVTPGSATICSGGSQLLSAPVSAGGNTITYSSTGAFTVPDNSTAGTVNPISVSGIPSDATVVDMAVVLNSITMARDNDLSINIESPNGDILNLANQEGSTSAANFTNTVISSLSSTDFGTSGPFTGTYGAAAGNLVGPSAHRSNTRVWTPLFDNPNGTWLLAIRDQRSSNIATVTAWSIIIHYTTPASSYTWGPTTGLYTDAGLSSAYAGLPTNTVYASPGSAQTYTVTKSEAGTACVSTATSAITVGGGPTLTGMPASQSVCYNATSAQAVSFSYTGITASANQYMLTWSPAGPANVPAFTALPGSPAGTINVNVPAGTAAGTYTGTLTIKNAAGCVTSSSITIVVNGAPALTGITTNQNLCFSASTAQTASFAYTGIANGANQYTLTWTPGSSIPNVSVFTAIPGSPGGTIVVSVPAGTPANTYTGTLTAKNSTTGCTATATITIVVNGLPTLSGATTAANACFNSTAAQTASFPYTGVTNGANQYTLTWSPSGPVDVTSFSALPGTSGAINVTVPAGTAAATYTGTLTVKNSVTGCTSTSPLTIAVNSLPALTGLPANTGVCFNSALAQTALIPYTGTANGANQYSLTWSPAGPADVALFTALPGSPSGTFNVNVPAGTSAATYAGTLSVKNSVTGCVSASTINITVNSLPSLTGLAATSNLCYNESSDQTASFPYTGIANGPDQYLLTWDPSGSLPNVLVPTALPGTPGGTFNINVPAGTGSNTYTGSLVLSNSVTGCMATTNIMAVVHEQPMLSGLSTNQSECFSASASHLSSYTYSGVSGDADQYMLTWSPASVLPDVAAFTALPAGAIDVTVPAGAADNTYTGTLTVKNSVTGCTSTTEITNTVNPLPTLAGLTTSQNFCFSAATAHTALFAYTGTTGGANEYTITWSPGSVLADVTTQTSIPGAAISVDVPAATPVDTYTGTLTLYSSASGCSSDNTVTTVINALPDAGAITGTLTTCPLAVINLTDAATGGVWSSSMPATATVNSTGDVTGVSAGTSTISYTVTSGSGCGTVYATAVVTVNAVPAPDPISGVANICPGSTVALSNPSPGGSWSSADLAIATVNASGVVSGVAGGTATISYAVSTGCGIGYATADLMIYNLPDAITGAANVCEGGTTTLSDATADGTWASSNATLATVEPTTGIVHGVNASGIPVISYTSTDGCTISADVTVNPLPAPITGTATVCGGSITTLNDIATGGTWASSDAGIAMATEGGPGIGIITGVSFGNPTITYTLATGCLTTTVITVNPTPFPIDGIANVCFGAVITLSDGLPDGSWSSSDMAIATVDPLLGIVTGVTPGTANITYEMPTGCKITKPVIFQAAPDAITGATDICTGATATFSDATLGGTWSSSDIALATVNSSGLVRGISAGSPTITYSIVPGCIATTTFSVNPPPAVPDPITGSITLCQASAIVLEDVTPGGSWSSSNTTVASVGVSSGVVIGLSAGATTISYTVANACGTTSAISVVTVNPLPATPAMITGTTTVCEARTTALSSITFGGTWSTSAAGVATVNPSGVVTGLSAGTATISYTKENSCGTASATTDVSVNPLPATPAAITGIAVVCESGAITTLSNTVPGGAWSSSNTLVARVVSSGDVTGVASGLANISYTISNGCGSVSATALVTVSPLPVHPGVITGTASVCEAAGTILHNAVPGGTWSSRTPAVATISSTGVATGVAGGTTVISYTEANSCGSESSVTTLTVNALPVADPITGMPAVCVGSVTVLHDLPVGGLWVSDNNLVAVVNALGVVSGVAPGSATISYVATNSCGSSSAATVNVTVTQLPSAGTITGSDKVCIGDTVILSNLVSGGTWSINNPLIATITSAGVVKGLSAGSDIVTYTFTNVCGTAETQVALTVRSINECNVGTATVANNTATELNAYPNPNNGSFTVMLSSGVDEQVHVVITNAVGRKVGEYTANTNKPLDIHMDKAAGTYFVTATTDHGRNVAKVVIQ